MPPLHILSIVGRALAFAVGCVCFYLAFFLFEDEEGKLQNRIDSLWVSIDDRAKTTDSITTAVLNNIAKVLFRLFNRIFGEARFSVQLVSVSINLSFAGMFAIATARTYLGHSVFLSTPQLVLFLLAITVLFLSLATVVIKYPRRWISILTCVPIVPILSVVTVWMIRNEGAFLGIEGSISVYALMLSLFIIVACISLASEVLSLAVIRKLFASVATSSTAFHIARATGFVGGLLFVICGAPLYIGNRLTASDSDLLSVIGVLLFDSSLLNFTTVIYCALPMCVLILLLVHKAIWPTMSRVLYPLSRYKLLTNQKAMTALGCLAWTFAFNIEQVGAKELLKLLS